MRSTTTHRTKSKLLDEYLVLSAQSGERTAMGQLARRWHPKMVAHAWRLTGDRELAEDAAQSAWGEIMHGLRRLRDPKAFPAWAYRIVSRTCSREIGTRVHQRALRDAVAAEPDEGLVQPEEPRETAMLQAAIGQLPSGERAAIALYYLEDMRVAEVAVALAIPAGTVKSRLMNARKKLRALLDPVDPENLQGEDHEHQNQ